jgi:hypothetical protein
LQFYNPHLSEAAKEFRRPGNIISEVDLDTQDAVSSFSSPCGSKTAHELANDPHYEFLTNAIWEHHPVLSVVFQTYNNVKMEGETLKAWLEVNEGNLLLTQPNWSKLVRGGELLIEGVQYYSTLRCGFHVFRTVLAQAPNKYNCGVIALFEEEGGPVEYYGEALEFLHIEIHDLKLPFVKVRWFDHAKTVEHRQLIDVPIIVHPIRYIPESQQKEFYPFIPVDWIKGSFFTGRMDIPKPCEGHKKCSRKLDSLGSSKKRVTVPCKRTHSDRILFPLSKWKPGDPLPEPPLEVNPPKSVRGTALLKHSKIQGSLQLDRF